jgi:hypothetical protein
MDAGPWFTLAKKQTLLLLIRHPFKFKTKLNLDFIFKYIFSNFVGHYSKKIPKKRKKKEKIIICES